MQIEYRWGVGHTIVVEEDIERATARFTDPARASIDSHDASGDGPIVVG